jgi:hypothetical protein
MNTKQKINTIKEIINKNKEGFTYKLTTLKPIKKNVGYCVGITNLKGIYLKPLIKQILTTTKSFKQIEKNLFIGGWFNKENKTFYLDLTLILKDKNTAIKTAKIFNQLAIFNLNKFEEIKTK